MLRQSTGESEPRFCFGTLMVSSVQGKYEEAKMLYERSVGTYEVTLGLKHPKIAAVLDSLSALAVKQA